MSNIIKVNDFVQYTGKAPIVSVPMYDWEKDRFFRGDKTWQWDFFKQNNHRFLIVMMLEHNQKLLQLVDTDTGKALGMYLYVDLRSLEFGPHDVGPCPKCQHLCGNKLQRFHKTGIRCRLKMVAEGKCWKLIPVEVCLALLEGGRDTRGKRVRHWVLKYLDSMREVFY